MRAPRAGFEPAAYSLGGRPTGLRAVTAGRESPASLVDRANARGCPYPSGTTECTRFVPLQRSVGIGRDDWTYLRDEIAAKLPSSSVSAVRESAYGFLYEVPMLVEGLNGATREVVTAWFVAKDEGVPRLASAYVNTP